jgi:hypothetical protein
MARLDAERWTRLQSLFHAAVDLDPDAWKPYLDREAADDPSLAARVEQMLEADRQTGASSTAARLTWPRMSSRRAARSAVALAPTA